MYREGMASRKYKLLASGADAGVAAINRCVFCALSHFLCYCEGGGAATSCWRDNVFEMLLFPCFLHHGRPCLCPGSSKAGHECIDMATCLKLRHLVHVMNVVCHVPAPPHRWMRQAGYPERLWGASASGKHTSVPDPGPELPLESLLSRQQRHVRMCKVCQQGQVLVSRVATAITAASVLAGAWALVLAAVAQVTAGSVAAAGVPLGVAAGVAVVMGLVAKSVWGFHEERFVSGVRRWRAKGGYSLVPDLRSV